jgi:succinate dehydrogenase hydrophobic anchor subunit
MARKPYAGGGSELTQKKSNTDGGLDFEYATRWSYGLKDMEFFTFIIPNMKGGASGGSLDEGSATYEALVKNGVPDNQAQQYIARLPLYWGEQPFTSGPIYFGAAAMFLFILSFFVVRSNIKWWIATVCILSLLLGFGHNTPFFKLLFDHLPFFNKFRTPTMALAIAQLCVPVMAALGLQEIINGTISKEDLLKKLKIAVGITAGIVVIIGIAGASIFSFSSTGDAQYAESFPDWMMAAIKKDRASLLRSDAFRSLFFIAAAFGLLWFFIQQKLSKTILLVSISALVLIDSWSVGKRYLNDESFIDAEQYKTGNYQPTEADLEILKDTDPNYRVYNTTRDPYNDALTSYYHKHIGGYHAVKLIKYQDLIENQLSKGNMNVFNMLNTRYFIGTNPQTKQPIAQHNPNACGNAWFVPQVKIVKNADEEMKSLDNFDPKQTLFVDQRYSSLVKAPATFDSSATVTLTLFTPNKLVYESNSAADGVAVFSEVYYDKGWNAYLDGKKADYFRGDYVLRAMSLPAGKHNIEFRFEPRPYFAGMKISYIGSIILFAFVIGIFGWHIYQSIQNNKSAKPASNPTPKKK